MTRATQGRVIAYRPEYATIAGSVAGGVFLAQLAYWQGKMGRAFFKSEADWRSETALSRREYTNARRALREAGLLTERSGFRQVRFFRLDLDELAARLAALGERHEPVAAAPERVTPACGSSHDLVGLNESVRTIWSDSVRTPCADTYQETTDTRLQKSKERGVICPVAPDERAPTQSYFRVDRSWADAPADTAKVVVSETALIAEFDALYDRWPRREKRGRARRAFLKAVREGVDKPTLVAGFEQALSVYEFEEKRFIPMLSAWITDERWCDEHDDDEPAGARVVVSPPAAAGYHRHGAARQAEDPDVLRWRARGKQMLSDAVKPRNALVEAARGIESDLATAIEAGVSGREPEPPAPQPSPRPEPAERIDHQQTGADLMAAKLDPFTDIEPADSRPEAERPAFEATPPTPEPARPASEPSPPPPEPEAALAAGERVLSHSEHMLLIAAGQCGPAPARGERRSAWPEHLRDAPKPLPAPGQTMTFSEHMAFLDHQRAERAARRAERCAARRRPAPSSGAFA